MGAMVAMEWEKQYSDFHKMFLINTSSSDIGSPFKRLSLKVLKNIPKILFTGDPSRAEKTILELTTELTDVNESLVNKWKEIALKYPISKRNFIRQLYAAAKFRSPKHLDITPTFLAATNDNLADFNSSKKLAKKYNSQIFIHESAGHDLPLDDPDWIIAKLTVSAHNRLSASVEIIYILRFALYNALYACMVASYPLRSIAVIPSTLLMTTIQSEFFTLSCSSRNVGI